MGWDPKESFESEQKTILWYLHRELVGKDTNKNYNQERLGLQNNERYNTRRRKWDKAFSKTRVANKQLSSMISQ